MNETIPNYLNYPHQIQHALDVLDRYCLTKNFEELYYMFEEALHIQNGDGFPITAVLLDGLTCRARLNDDKFHLANNVSEIGVKKFDISQGRANPVNRPIFYGANRKITAAYEILQNKAPGIYEVTIGCWKSNNGLRLVNFVDGADADFEKIPFVHSMPRKYLDEWPDLPKKSAFLLSDYFREKFKSKYEPGLYNITNIIAAVCFSLQGIDGIGYGATSDSFEGYNVAIRHYEKLTCMEVERWLIQKFSDDEYIPSKIAIGTIKPDESIVW